jgi:hypothetical protein
MPCCTYVKLNGEVCGRSHGDKFDFCANHRPRDAVRPFKACEACGTMTRLSHPKTGAPLCIKQSCGMYTHQAECKRRRRAEKRAEAAKRAREAEEAKNQDACARVLDEYVAELVESFDASTVRPVPPPPPPASWKALSDEARSELMCWIRQFVEAERRDAPQQPAAAISSH